jgi:hypothetical protein
VSVECVLVFGVLTSFAAVLITSSIITALSSPSCAWIDTAAQQLEVLATKT